MTARKAIQQSTFTVPAGGFVEVHGPADMIRLLDATGPLSLQFDGQGTAGFEPNDEYRTPGNVWNKVTLWNATPAPVVADVLWGSGAFSRGQAYVQTLTPIGASFKVGNATATPVELVSAAANVRGARIRLLQGIHTSGADPAYVRAGATIIGLVYPGFTFLVRDLYLPPAIALTADTAGMASVGRMMCNYDLI